MIGPASDQDLLPIGMGPRYHHGHGGRVGAVLAENGPLRMIDKRYESFSKTNHNFGRPGHGVAKPLLSGCCRVHGLVAVPEKVGTVGPFVVGQVTLLDYLAVAPELPESEAAVFQRQRIEVI